MGLTDALFA